jgi:O-succinylhomoserine sulfhydrylase
MTHQLHPQTLAIRGSKEQTAYNEHHQALFLTSSFMFDNAMLMCYHNFRIRIM